MYGLVALQEKGILPLGPGGPTARGQPAEGEARGLKRPPSAGELQARAGQRRHHHRRRSHHHHHHHHHHPPPTIAFVPRAQGSLSRGDSSPTRHQVKAMRHAVSRELRKRPSADDLQAR